MENSLSDCGIGGWGFWFVCFVYLVFCVLKRLQFYSVKLHKFWGVVLESSSCLRKRRTVLKILVKKKQTTDLNITGLKTAE